MLYASISFSCQQLFSKFFQDALRLCLFRPALRRFGSGIASARRRFMPKSAALVKHFFAYFWKFFAVYLQYIVLYGFLLEDFSGLGWVRRVGTDGKGGDAV